MQLKIKNFQKTKYNCVQPWAFYYCKKITSSKCPITNLSHKLWVVKHVWNLWVALHQVLHLWVGHYHLPHQVRVGHHALHKRVLHDLRQHLRVGHELSLHLLLKLHEVGRSHPKVRQAREVTKPSWKHTREPASNKSKIKLQNCLTKNKILP